MIAITRTMAAKELSISLPELDKLLTRKNDPIPSLWIGRKRIVPVDLLHEWLKAEVKRSLPNTSE